MTETRDSLEGVDASPDRDVRVAWGGRMHPTLDDIRAYYKRNRIAPPWFNPSPRFGLRPSWEQPFWSESAQGALRASLAITATNKMLLHNDFPPPTPEPSP